MAFNRISYPARRGRALVVGVVLGVTLAMPMWVLASHQFADVPTSNPFHADISALADSGVTGGCGGGNFCPNSYVTRAQMAAFLNRLGALAPGKPPVVNADRLDGLHAAAFVQVGDSIDADRLNGLEASSFARADLTQHYSCSISDMAPLGSGTTYDGTFGVRQITAGYGVLTCAVHLPDGATVTGFEARVFDVTTDYEVHCGMRRTSPGSSTEMAATPGSGVSPGNTTLVAPGITNPVIDNGAHAYTAWCDGYAAPGATLAAYQVTVEYIGAP